MNGAFKGIAYVFLKDGWVWWRPLTHEGPRGPWRLCREPNWLDLHRDFPWDQTGDAGASSVTSGEVGK